MLLTPRDDAALPPGHDPQSSRTQPSRTQVSQARWGQTLPRGYDPARDPYRVYLDSLDSAESRRTMRGCLDRIARLIVGDPEAGGAGQPWWLLRYEHTVRIRTLLREQTGETGPAYSPASVNKHLVALRRVLRESWRLGLMSAEDYERAADLPSVEHTRLPRGHHVPDRALAAALAVCENDLSMAGRRDCALLAVLYTTGARRGEIAGLGIDDYDAGERSLRVRGKRDKERLVYVTVEAATLLDRWIAARGRTPGALFPPVNKAGRCGRRTVDGRVQFAHPTGQAIAGILARRLTEAGAPQHTPHDFRRTFIGELLDAGVDLATAQRLVGHSSPATTARYDRRPERRRREAVDRLRLPGPGGS